MKIPVVLVKTMFSGSKSRGESWCKVGRNQLSKKTVIFFLDKFEESIGSEFLPKTLLLCATVVYFFVHQYNFTKMTKKVHHMAWFCLHIDPKKNPENPENPENPGK